MNRFLSVRRSVAAFLVIAAMALGGLIALAVTAHWYSPGTSGKVPVFISSARADSVANLGTLAPVVKNTAPAVVSITASKVVRERRSPLPPIFNDPRFRDFFGDRFPDLEGPPEAERQQGLGSGVVVSPDGYILTNNHVVDGATDIAVVLNDRRELKAKAIGADPMSDLAVLKVAATGLPVIPLTDSNRVAVGDFALAIGNPFGIGQTVTFGIISATGRSGLGIEDYEDFIQTDAAINPGNSGGALVNTAGQLIGINTAIVSRGGGNQGIGFAIPVNMAKQVMEQIIKHGKVTRGYLGVTIQEVTPTLARGLGLKDAKGVVVNGVEPNSPAARAGIERGDVIVGMNGQDVDSLSAFRLRVSQLPPGTPVRLRALRNNVQKDVTVTLGELPTEAASAEGPAQGNEGNPLQGVSVEPLTPQIARQLNLRPDTSGVVVTDISQASDAFADGLRRGDVIQEVNRQKVNSVSDFERAVRASGTKPLVLLVNRRGQTIYIAIERNG